MDTLHALKESLEEVISVNWNSYQGTLENFEKDNIYLSLRKELSFMLNEMNRYSGVNYTDILLNELAFHEFLLNVNESHSQFEILPTLVNRLGQELGSPCFDEDLKNFYENYKGCMNSLKSWNFPKPENDYQNELGRRISHYWYNYRKFVSEQYISLVCKVKELKKENSKRVFDPILD